MANQLKMVDVVSILTLHARGWSCRRIARELGVDRDAVSRHVKLSAAGAGTPDGGAQPSGVSKPATEALTGIFTDPAEPESKPATEALTGICAGQAVISKSGECGVETRSHCAPWRQFIVDQLAAGHSAQRIYQDLVSDHGYVGSYHSVRRLARKLNRAARGGLPFRRMECSPGDEAQVDFGSGARIVGADGRRHRSHVFRIVLSHSEQNAYLAQWESSVADLRIHGTTKRQVREAFEQSERSALLALPAGRFELFQEAQRCVHRDGHVEVKRAYYSVPPEFVGQRVWVRFDGRVVRIFDLKMQQIALHAQHEAGRFSTHAPHIAAQKRSIVERGAAWLIDQAGRLGPHARAWAQAMIQERGVEAMRALVGLNSLGQRYPARSIDQACQIAHGHGAWRLRVVRELLERRQPPQEQGQLPFISEHPIIRPLSDYTQLIREAFTQ